MELIKKLKAKGFRITKSRALMIELFENNPNTHFNLEEIREYLKKNQNHENIATIYNNLNFLIKESIIEPYFFDDKRVLYELKKDFHAHLICENCGSIENTNIPGLACVDQLISQNNQFVVHNSKIEFYGLCKNCQSQNEINLIDFPEEIDSAVNAEKYINKILKAENQEGKEISLIFIEDKKMKKLNNQYLEHNYVTDVLSFPDDLEQGGDIYIATSKIYEQAEKYGHSPKRELYFLITHGILHVLGYDHDNLQNEKIMMTKTEKYLKANNVVR